MSKNTPRQNTIKSAAVRNGLILALFALISTGLIATIHLVTKDRIKQEIELSMISQLKIITDQAMYNNDVYKDCLLVNSSKYLGSYKNQKVYRMRLQPVNKKIDKPSNSLATESTDWRNLNLGTNTKNNYAVMLITTAPDGYSGNIEIAVAIKSNGNILGVNILSHQETPGLGDKIERRKSNWLEQFVGLSLTDNSSNYWNVKKDGGEFDALTGATITPRAVIKSVHKGLMYFQEHSNELFENTSNCGDNL